MLGRLFLLFLALPLLDLVLLFAIGGRVGLLPTLALVVATAAAGAWLARREGAGAWRRVQAALARGATPGPELLEALIVFTAGVLLAAPGFLTDIVGLVGLLLPTRRALRDWLGRRFQRAVQTGTIRVATPFGAGHPFEATVGARPPAVGPGIEDAEVLSDRRVRATDAARGA